MNIFGSAYYAYKNLKKNLDSKWEKGIFVANDKNSLSYLVFYSENKRVLKHKLMKFVNNMTNQQTHTYPINDDDNDEDFFEKNYTPNQKLYVSPDSQISSFEYTDRGR